MEMDSDSPLHGEMPDGAEVSPLAENQPEDVDGEISENNVSSLDAAAVEESATNGEPISSSDALDVEPDALPAEEQPGPDQVNAEAEEEMDIDDSAADAEPEGEAEAEAEAEVDAEAAAEADAEADPDAEADVDAEAEAAAQAETEESAYIGDNCLSTPAETEENSPQESQIDQIKEELDEAEEAGAEESPDQSISSAMPTDSGVGEGDEPKWKEEIQDDESSTMDEDMGGGEGVASSDDVNDISSAAQEALSSAAQEALSTAISSSTAESGADISSSGQSETALISSTANGPAVVHSFSLAPQLPQSNVFGDADTSEMEGAADTMPIVSESMPILTMSANSSAMLSPTFTQGEESSGGGVSSSVAGVGLVGAAAAGAEAEGAVSSSGAAKAPLPPTDAAHALATLASAALHHQHDQAEPEEPKLNDEDVWYTVGIVKGTSFTVQNYLSDPYVDLSSLSLDNLPDLSGMPTTPLEHGTAYKFRIAAFNSCGRGEFSEESAFKTCLPGFPGAPSAIKISKSVEGAHLSWEPPQVAAEGIFEYSVYLAVRSNSQPKEAAKSQLAFVRVYCGKSNTCVVAQSSLSAAHVDSSTKPAIIFRIAARNEKGYGPATQVRWLQDIKSTGVKRAGEGRLPGASPSKQPKQILH